jgi:hypothetical protein
MNSRAISTTVYALIAACGVGLHLRSRVPGSRVPSLGALFSAAMRHRPGRVGIVVGWAWLGLHFFAR